MRGILILVAGTVVAACAGGERAGDAARDSVTAQPVAQDTEQADMAGDTSQTPTAEGGATMDTTTVEGTVQVVGADPFPQVVLQVGEGAAVQQIAITGPLRDELGTLHGITVRVAGRSVANPQGVPSQAIEVTGYDVVSVNGEQAYVGILAIRDGDMWLDASTATRLSAVPTELESKAGAKVWITGPIEDGVLRVQSYGVIREP